MRFIPDYTLRIIGEEEFPTAIRQVEKQLEPCRNEGYFVTFDGKKIYYEYFLAENSTASIVIVHGLSEFTKKFYEVTSYFLHQGYNVFLYDQRCHGLSDRLTDRIDLIHVDRYDDYAEDLRIFIDTVVTPVDDKPLYLYSHSMGGAVSLLYLAKYRDKIQKAVLSAPLIEPVSVDLPRWFICPSVGLAKWFCGRKSKFPLSSEFNPDHPHRKSADASKNRFEHNLNMRRENPQYQTTPLSFGWNHRTLQLRPRLLSRRITRRIQTPLLLLSAEKDTVVKNEPQHIFAARCPVCTLVTVKDTNHGMLTGTYETLTEHLTRTLDFYRG